ncbi:MAG: hypothetical protein FWD47_11795 [Treponema sp.]|nr:hypothetical protein [Treponema sp.]
MKISKTMAFIFCMSAIGAMFIITAALHLFNKYEGFPIGAFLTATVSMGTSYMAIQVTNNGVKGKYWNPQMNDAENNKIGGVQ